MSKFFTWLPGLLLASFGFALASEEMPILPPAPGPETAEATVALPAPLSAGRFAALSRKSPFTLASATQENADFAKELILAGYVRLEGKEFVMVAKRNGPERLMIGTQPSPSAQGMILEKVVRDPSGDPTKMSAVLRKGTETATLQYEKGGAAPMAAPGGAQPQVVPGAAPVPPQGQPQVTAGQAPAQNPPVIRRRVVPIPSSPPR